VFNIIFSTEKAVITCWTCEAITEIEAALNIEPCGDTAQSDDDLSHIPTFGILLDLVATPD